MTIEHVDKVTATGKGEWTIELYDVRGICNISITTDTQWRPKQSKIALYQGSPPSDPADYHSFNWWALGTGSPWDTGQNWGPGWSAALIAQDTYTSETGSWHYVAQTAVTS